MSFKTSLLSRNIPAPIGFGEQGFTGLRVRYRHNAKPSNAFNAGGKYNEDPVLVVPKIHLNDAGQRFAQAQGWQRITRARRAMMDAVNVAASRSAQNYIEHVLCDHGGLSFKDMDQQTWTRLMQRTAV